ncbi:MAG: dockerin type I repeat-containing protein [Oscillospiraceae bacterium]|jgi:hypothetical protein|nr:dockerin type I repeat-containing protein [Oscillospiraceae bacterium]
MKKKLLSILIAMVFAVGMVGNFPVEAVNTSAPLEEQPSYKINRNIKNIVFLMKSGDGNNDGKLEADDAILLAQYLVKKIDENKLNISNLDVNDDENVNIIDLVNLCKVVVGIPTIDISMVSDIEVASLTDTDLEKFKTAYNKCVYEDGTMEDAQTAYAYYRAIIDKYDMKNFKITDENVAGVFGDLIYSYFDILGPHGVFEDMLYSGKSLKISEELYYYNREKDEIIDNESRDLSNSWTLTPVDKVSEPNVTSIKTFRDFLAESYSSEIVDYIIDCISYKLIEKNGALYIESWEAGWFEPVLYETIELIEEKNGVYKVSFLEVGAPAGGLYNYWTFDIQKINGKYKIINIENLFGDDVSHYWDYNDIEKITITGDLYAGPSEDSKLLFNVNQGTFDLFYTHKIDGEIWYLVEGFNVEDYENYIDYDKYYGEGSSEWMENEYKNYCYGWYKKQ